MGTLGDQAATLYVVVPPSPLFAAHWSFVLPDPVDAGAKIQSHPTKGRRVHVSGDRLYGFALEIVRGYDLSKHRSVSSRQYAIGLIQSRYLQQRTHSKDLLTDPESKDNEEGGGYIDNTPIDEFEQTCVEVEAPGRSLRNAASGVSVAGRVQKTEVRDCQRWVREVVKLLVERGMLEPVPADASWQAKTPVEIVNRVPAH